MLRKWRLVTIYRFKQIWLCCTYSVWNSIEHVLSKVLQPDLDLLILYSLMLNARNLIEWQAMSYYILTKMNRWWLKTGKDEFHICVLQRMANNRSKSGLANYKRAPLNCNWSADLCPKSFRKYNIIRIFFEIVTTIKTEMPIMDIVTAIHQSVGR